MNPKNKTLYTTFIGLIISFIIHATLLSGCATNDELYAKYENACPVPEKTIPKIKIVEKFIEKIKIQEKIVERIKIVKEALAGDPWEPAVYFGFDLSTLEPTEIARLKSDVDTLKKHPEFKVSIQSFTDVKGSNAYNRALALRRQKTVLTHLKTLGLTPDRIIASPLGEELPILLSESKQHRLINRRVELMLLDNQGRPLTLEIQPKSSPFTPPKPVK